MNHIDEITCMLYLDGQLERGRALELTQHVEGCGHCRRLLEALEHESVLLRDSLVEEDEAVPARLLTPPERLEKTAWAWITALGFAAAGVYTLWVQMIDPWREQLAGAGFGEQNLLSLLFFSGAFWGGWEDVMNLVQTVATGTLLLLGLMVVVRLRRRWTTFAVVMGSLAMLLLLPAPVTAEALFVKKGASYTFPAGETHRGDMFVFCATGRIDGNVEGDLFVFGESVTVNGNVKGDVIGFAKSLRIAGEVDGNVRGFANAVIISGRVTRNVTVFTETLEFDQRAIVDGSMTVFTASAGIDGTLGRDLAAFAKKTRLAGKVGGDVNIRGEHLTIDSTTDIAGKTKFYGRNKAEVSPQAKLGTPLEFTESVRKNPYGEWRFYWRQALRWGAAFVFGLILLWMAPLFFREALRKGDDLAVTLGWGGAFLFLVPIAAIVACVTLVGLAVGIGTMFIWIVALYASQVFAGAWMGEKLMGARGTTPQLIGSMALGLLILRVGFNLPYVGGWIGFATIVWGLGLFGAAVYGRLKSQPQPAPVQV